MILLVREKTFFAGREVCYVWKFTQDSYLAFIDVEGDDFPANAIAPNGWELAKDITIRVYDVFIDDDKRDCREERILYEALIEDILNEKKQYREWFADVPVGKNYMEVRWSEKDSDGDQLPVIGDIYPIEYRRKVQ